MRIAICEDDLAQLERLRNLVNESKYFDSNSIDIFRSGEEVIESYENGNLYEILILDMELGGINGIQVANWIRDFGSPCEIIIVSGILEFAVKGYSIQAFDFILKPVEENHFQKILNKAIFSFKNSQQQTYQLKSRGLVKAIHYDAIMFIESNGRKTIFHCKNSEVMVSNESISSVESQLSQNDFVRISRFYIVHLKYVKEINSNHVELSSGEKLTMSVQKSDMIKQKYLDYLVGICYDV